MGRKQKPQALVISLLASGSQLNDSASEPVGPRVHRHTAQRSLVVEFSDFGLDVLHDVRHRVDVSQAVGQRSGVKSLVGSLIQRLEASSHSLASHGLRHKLFARRLIRLDVILESDLSEAGHHLLHACGVRCQDEMVIRDGHHHPLDSMAHCASCFFNSLNLNPMDSHN